MRNIFLFIRRYFTFLSFLALQAVALYFLFTYNKYHRAVGLGVANELTGRINTQYNKVDGFFHLRQENARIHKMNDSLMNLMKSNFMVVDTSVLMVKDSIPFDTLGHYRRYYWRPARVISNSVTAQNGKNYLQLNRGARNGIKDNMAVLSSDGSAVGVVVNVSENFSQVISLLNVQNVVSASLKKTKEIGNVEWDGKDARYVLLKGLPKSIDVQKGDTVLTSSYSYNFPPGYIIGTVAEILIDKATGFYTLKIKTAANFYNLQQVFVVENLQRDEQIKLDEETQKKMDNNKKQGH